jgi:hypothetical protein
MLVIPHSYIYLHHHSCRASSRISTTPGTRKDVKVEDGTTQQQSQEYQCDQCGCIIQQTLIFLGLQLYIEQPIDQLGMNLPFTSKALTIIGCIAILLGKKRMVVG